MLTHHPLLMIVFETAGTRFLGKIDNVPERTVDIILAYEIS